MVVSNEVNSLGYGLVIQTTKWKHERNLTLPDALGPCNFFSWIEFQIGIEVNHTDLVDSYVIGSRYGSKAGLNRSKLDLREQVWEWVRTSNIWCDKVVMMKNKWYNTYTNKYFCVYKLIDI